MHTSGPFIQNPTSQPMVHFVVTSILVQPIILNPLVLLVQVTHLIQRRSQVKSLLVFDPSSKWIGHATNRGGKSESFYDVWHNQCEWLTSSYGWNEPAPFCAIPNYVGPAGSSNVQYQQPNPVYPSGSSNVNYQQKYVVQVQY